MGFIFKSKFLKHIQHIAWVLKLFPLIILIFPQKILKIVPCYGFLGRNTLWHYSIESRNLTEPGVVTSACNPSTQEAEVLCELEPALST